MILSNIYVYSFLTFMGKYIQTVCRKGKMKERCETTLKKKLKESHYCTQSVHSGNVYRKAT